MGKDFFWIYMLRCSNNSYYTGYTVNLTRRYWQHLNKKGNAKYTGAFHPEEIACCWLLRDTKGTALKIEHLLRKKSRTIKDDLVHNPDRLKEMATGYLGSDVDIVPFDPRRVEQEVSLHERCPRHDPFNSGENLR